MINTELPDDMGAADAETMGCQRFENMALFDAPLLIPPQPAWTVCARDLARRQIAAAQDMEVLLSSYIELLVRAKSLVGFWEANVGPTEDWPVSVIGENDEVEACLQRRVVRLREIVEFVEESACS